jgi:ketosteroid isomerase-like protein
MNKREIALSFLGGAAMAAFMPGAAPADAQAAAGEGMVRVEAWLEALRSGDKEVVARVLAPEFQIMRSNGTGFDRNDYLDNLPKIDGKPVVSGLVATAHGGTLVCRYMVEAAETIGGAPVETKAPRLTVLRKEGESWLTVAHANFARIG